MLSMCIIMLMLIIQKLKCKKMKSNLEMTGREITSKTESSANYQTIVKELNTVIKDLAQVSEIAKNNNSNQIEKKYMESIENAHEDDKSTLIRHCFNRLPSSYNLLYFLWENQKVLIENASSTIMRRNLVIDMNNAVTLYRGKCNIEDLNKADYFFDELEKISDGLLVKLRNEQRDNVESQIKQLEENIERLSNDKNNEEIIKDLERLDNSLDKEFIESLPTLKARYKNCSESLISLFSTDTSSDEEDSEKEKKYNFNAIDSYKKALQLFEEDTGLLEENNFKKGIGLARLVELIGGWDNRYLLPSTMSYTNTIYGMIFSKLKKEAQLNMTKLMVKEKKKVL